MASFSLLGMSSWSPSFLRGFLQVKVLSTCWTSDGGAFSIVTFLKASLVETLLGQAVEGFPVVWWGGLVQMASSKGVT